MLSFTILYLPLNYVGLVVPVLSRPEHEPSVTSRLSGWRRVESNLPVRVDICIHSGTASEGHVDSALSDCEDGILLWMNLSFWNFQHSTIKQYTWQIVHRVVRTIEPFLTKLRMDEDRAERRAGWEVLSFLTQMLDISSQKSQDFIAFCGYILNGFFRFHPFFFYRYRELWSCRTFNFERGAATEIVFSNRWEVVR